MISHHFNRSGDRKGQALRTMAIPGLRWHLKGGQERAPGTLNPAFSSWGANSTNF